MGDPKHWVHTNNFLMLCNPEGTHHWIRYLLNHSVTKRWEWDTLMLSPSVLLLTILLSPACSYEFIRSYFSTYGSLYWLVSPAFVLSLISAIRAIFGLAAMGLKLFRPIILVAAEIILASFAKMSTVLSESWENFLKASLYLCLVFSWVSTHLGYVPKSMLQLQGLQWFLVPHMKIFTVY